MLDITPRFAVVLPDGTHATAATCWADTDLGTYCRLLGMDASVDTYGMLAAVLGTTRAQIMALPIDEGQKLVAAVDYLAHPLPKWPVPPVVSIPGATPGQVVGVVPPLALDACTFGQATDLGSFLEEYAEQPAQLRLYALATYLMPGYYSLPYDGDRLEEFATICKSIKLGEGLPLADFFIWTMSGLPPATVPGLKKYPYLLMKKQQATATLARIGKRMPWLARWLGGMRYAYRTLSGFRGTK